MPRILRIINRFNLGGITYNVSYLSKYLAPEFETLLVGGEKLPDEESSLFIPEQMGVSPRIIPEMSRELSPLKDLAAYRKLRSIIREFKPDIVHTHAAKAGALGRFAAIREKVPVIVHTFHGHVFHSYFNRGKTALFKNVERYLAKRTDAIVALSETQKEELMRQHHIASAEKFRIIPLGFDLERFANAAPEHGEAFRKQWNIPASRYVITIVGRLVPIKDHVLFIRTLQQLAIRYPGKITAVIVGDGSERAALETEKKVCGLRDDELIFTSWIRDTVPVYEASDLVMLTSKNEGTPVSLIEAMASGKPVVSTPAGGVDSVILKGSGIIVADPTPQTLADAVEQYLLDTEGSRRAGEAGRRYVLERFGFQRLVSETGALYRELLRMKHKAS